MPALALDLGHVADGDVTDPDPGVLFDVVHVGHLRLDGERAGAALGARQRKRVQPRQSPHPDTAAASTSRPAAAPQPDSSPAHHDPAPGGTIRPCRPSAGLVAIGASAASGGVSGGTAYGGGPPSAGSGGGLAGGGRLRRNVIGPHPVLAVGDLVGPRRAPTKRFRPRAGSCTGGS